jgi:hypothetical protein
MRPTCLIFLTASIAATLLFHPGRVLGTAPEAYKTSVLALGRFGAIDASGARPYSPTAKGKEQLWSSLQVTKGYSDVYVQNNVWAPGGSSGWHSHPGHSLIIVMAGTVTDYEGHDPGRKRHVYKAGMGFVDPGGDHVHCSRNRTFVPEGSPKSRSHPNENETTKKSRSTVP